MLKQYVAKLMTEKNVKNNIKALSDEEKSKVSGGYSHKDHARNDAGPDGMGPGRHLH